MKKPLSILAVSLSLGFASCYAQLTINDCVRLATANYPEVARYNLANATKQYSLSNAAKAWYPQGSVYAQASWQNDVMALPDALSDVLRQQGIDYPGLRHTQYRAGADITQQIWDGGQNAASRKLIKTSAEIERSSIDANLYDVKGRVEELYFGLLLINERINTLNIYAGVLGSTLSQMRSMQINGIAMQSDCDRIEARLISQRQQIIQQEALRDSYRRILELFIGEPLGTRTLVMPEKRQLDHGNAPHPQLRLFDSRLNGVTARKAGIQASLMPRIGAFATAFYGYPGYNYFKSMQSREMSFNFVAGIKLSWNFGALYSRNYKLAELRIEQEQIETGRQTFMFNNTIAELEAKGKIAALDSMIAEGDKVVELYRSVRLAAQSQLRNGIIDSTSLLAKIADEEIAEINQISRKLELLKTHYQLIHIQNR